LNQYFFYTFQIFFCVTISAYIIIVSVSAVVAVAVVVAVSFIWPGSLALTPFKKKRGKNITKNCDETGGVEPG